MLASPLLLCALCSIFRFVAADEVSDALSATPTATIAPGRIVGTTTNIAGPTGSIAVNKFLGIPYAAPPTGEARFQPPQAPAPWQTRDTKAFSASCMQVFAPAYLRELTVATFNNPAPVESEDCLYLNVFAPKKAWDPSRPPYPVLYWMYGGAWKFGNAGQPWYDGSHFSALEDVIVVSVNYRTNVFGLPISPAIPLTERNVGVLDQRAGLQWVQDNIRHFGGDPTRVTIFGESAGAYSVDLLITSHAPNAPRPFRAAIMESGSYAYQVLPNCTNDYYGAWNALAAAPEVQCTQTSEAEKLACIKSKDPKVLKTAQENNVSISFGHACDNVTVVSDPRNRVEAGNVANVPVIIGTNTADGSFYTIPHRLNTTEYLEANGLLPLRDYILATYPLGSEGRIDEQDQMQQIHTDWSFHCPAVWYAETSAPQKPTYRYLFNATFNNTRVQYPLWPERYQGAYHTSEIPIVFTSYNESTAEVPAQRALSDTMRRAWANFAKDPSQQPLPNWPRVTPANGDADVMGFGTDGKAASGPIVDAHKCQFWASLGFRTYHA